MKSEMWGSLVVMAISAIVLTLVCIFVPSTNVLKAHLVGAWGFAVVIWLFNFIVRLPWKKNSSSCSDPNEESSPPRL
jgi:hypothetical protein